MRCTRHLVILFGVLVLAAACSASGTAEPTAASTATATSGPAATASSGGAERESPRPATASESRSFPDAPSAAEREQLPSCDGAAFTVAPVDLALLSEITPLGNMGPPAHTTPTEHTYLHFADAQQRTTTVYPLVSPAEITLLLVRSPSSVTMDPEDHSISFALCQDVYGYFDHIKSLSDEVATLLTEIECATYTDDSSGNCERALFATLPAGTLLGQVGRLQGNFDFGAMDMRVTHSFANADRYQFARTPHIVCPYDYFEGELKQQLYSLLDRTAEPRCGEVAQDVPGTLQGVWFQPGSDVVVGSDGQLTFVPDNFRPETHVIAIGGMITAPGRVEFTPVVGGTVNRAFIDVTPDSALYCYQRDGTGRHEQVQNPDLISGKIIVQLVSATELRVEHQPGSCGSADGFATPATYFR